MAIETDWIKAPAIEQIEHEFGSLEVKVTKSGLYSYAAPDGEHDDVVMAGMLSISGAFVHAQADEAERMMEDLENETESEDGLSEDELDEVAETFDDDDEFFAEDEDDEAGDDDTEDEKEFDDLDALS